MGTEPAEGMDAAGSHLFRPRDAKTKTPDLTRIDHKPHVLKFR